ncbi:hypothetical protein Sps_01489 [Shewanella psychrophila]|uniref:Uncharacterized protein n=1 Tax=Shewanella psychrophila TaxID=225848 RepID=A0A1S6HM95_9GAMM|nr:hypothetical protein Sps_01489 [Shewanella psychrophila]
MAYFIDDGIKCWSYRNSTSKNDASGRNGRLSYISSYYFPISFVEFFYLFHNKNNETEAVINYSFFHTIYIFILVPSSRNGKKPIAHYNKLYKWYIFLWDV